MKCRSVGRRRLSRGILAGREGSGSLETAAKPGFGAFVPDLPGCVAVGETREQSLQLVREAVELHVASLREAGEHVPPPTSTAERVSFTSRHNRQLQRTW